MCSKANKEHYHRGLSLSRLNLNEKLNEEYKNTNNANIFY